MGDDVLINKAATIERCVARAREEFAADPAGFATNFTRQDAAILNILTQHLDEFLEFSRQMLKRDAA